MTVLYLRTDAAEEPPEDGFLLDWFGPGASSTVAGTAQSITTGLGSPTPAALDLLRVAVAVYCADKIVPRSIQPDLWTRPMRLHVPVTDSRAWRDAAPQFAEALAFLSNDRWSFRFRRTEGHDEGVAPLFGADAVSLFSGGLDSLVGAIDLLESGRSVVLVGHYDSNLLRPRQQALFERLREIYGEDRVAYRPFYLRLATASPAQARPLPSAKERESTTRSRSFLFIGAASVAASVFQLGVVHVPENGYIGLNIPLEASRLGACSTRTTHPHFFRLLQEATTGIGGPSVRNPYELLTKGEVLQGCANQDLLSELAPLSVSCAHPEVGRWREASYGNCGYCYPCLMRRVALHTVGQDDPTAYRVDVADTAFVTSARDTAGHIRALIDSIRQESAPSDVLLSGPLPRGRVREFNDLYGRGREEIRTWLRAAVPASR